MSKKIVYKQIETVVKERIINGEYPAGSQLPTDNRLAQEFAISRLTVAKALNSMVADGWLERARGRGTFVASKLPREQFPVTGIIKFISPPSQSHGALFTPAILNGLLEGVREHGENNVGIEIYNTEEELVALLNTFTKPDIGGMVIWANQNSDLTEIFSRMQEAHFPFVQIDSKAKNSESDLVSSDNFYGAEMAVDHLVANGHKRIAYITIPLFQDILKRRLGGVLVSLYKNNVECSSNIIVMPDFHKNIGVNLMTAAEVSFITEWIKKTYTGSDRSKAPTAIFCSNDSVAIEVLQQLRLHSVKVPEEVELIGFDNIPQSEMPMIELTTVAQDFFTMGKLAAHLLFLPRDPTVPELEFRYCLLRPTLKIRKTAR